MRYRGDSLANTHRQVEWMFLGWKVRTKKPSFCWLHFLFRDCHLLMRSRAVSCWTNISMLHTCCCDAGEQNRVRVKEDWYGSFTMISMQTCFGSGVRITHIYTCFLCMLTRPNRVVWFSITRKWCSKGASLCFMSWYFEFVRLIYLCFCYWSLFGTVHSFILSYINEHKRTWKNASFLLTDDRERR